MLSPKMLKISIILIILAIVLVLVYVFRTFVISTAPTASTNSEIAANNQATKPMILTSPSFENNGYIPQKFTCDGFDKLTTGGGNINPELQIQNVPAEAKSLALILHDPDAPIAGGFTHWLVWNIAPDTAAIKEGNVPAGSIEGKNDAKRSGYTRPCPPVGHGVHHYHFKLYALDSVLNLVADSSKEELESEINKHLLESAELVGLYQR